MTAYAPSTTKLRYLWLFGWQNDLLFFFLPIFAGILLFYVFEYANSLKLIFWVAILGQALGLGPFHQGATWFHYFDKRNWHHFFDNRTQRLKYFFVPAIIVLLSAIGIFVCRPLVMLIYIAWSVQHAVQQNFGILLLYHNHKAGEAIAPRDIEQKSIRSAAIFFSLLFFSRIYLNPASPIPGWQIIIAASLIWAIYCSALYVKELIKQMRAGAFLNVPALVFWFISVFYLWPFAFLGSKYDDAFLIPLVIHWFQYIGLNLILAKEKYAQNKNADLPMKNAILLYLGVCLIWALFVMAIILFAISFPAESWMSVGLIGIVVGLGMVHYYQDTFIWRFRDSFPRETLLPYLVAKKATN
jgi:hypothetical protein